MNAWFLSRFTEIFPAFGAFNKLFLKSVEKFLRKGSCTIFLSNIENDEKKKREAFARQFMIRTWYCLKAVFP